MKMITSNHHVTLMTSRSLNKRSRSVYDGYTHLVTAIAPERLNNFELPPLLSTPAFSTPAFSTPAVYS